jgi:hypothetical protein
VALRPSSGISTPLTRMALTTLPEILWSRMASFAPRVICSPWTIPEIPSMSKETIGFSIFGVNGLGP